MNAAHAAATFQIATVATLPTCDREICMACCAGTCPDAKVQADLERADVEAHAPAQPVWSEDDLAALNAHLDVIDGQYDADRAHSEAA